MGNKCDREKGYTMNKNIKNQKAIKDFRKNFKIKKEVDLN